MSLFRLNQKYRRAVQKTISSITNGQSLHQALSEQKLFPSQMIHLIALGEETGKLDLMLEKTSSIYNEGLNNIIDNLNKLLEPILMIVLGIIVGSLIIGIYLPIFRLGSIL